MPTQVQSRRGTTTQHSTFTGAAGELTVDTDKKTVVVHDGSTAGGAPLLRENGSQNAVTTGTSTAASFIPTSSTAPTNGVYLPAANSVAISTNGSGRLFVDSSGRVGIGTSSVASTLHIVDSSFAGNGTIRLGGGGASTGYYSTIIQNSLSDGKLLFNSVAASGSVHGHQFQVDGTAAVTIDASRRVGIGSASPGRVLEIGTTGPAIKFNNGTNAWTIGTGAFVDGTDSFLIFEEGVGERLRVDNSGRLLVGTSSANTNVAAGHVAQVQIEGTGYAQSTLGIFANSNDANGSYLFLAKSRGTTVGSNTLVQSGDLLGQIRFLGSDGSGDFSHAANIEAWVDGTASSTSMPTRLVFSTCPSGSNGPTERLKINASGYLYSVPTYNNAQSLSANVFVFSDGSFGRATSSIKYKKDVETIEDYYADLLLNCRPVWYRAINSNQNPDWGYWGFIAEEVAEIDPRLVHWKTIEVTYDENGSAVETPLENPEPEGVQYDRFVPHLINLIKRQKEQIEAMEARLTALESA